MNLLKEIWKSITNISESVYYMLNKMVPLLIFKISIFYLYGNYIDNFIDICLAIMLIILTLNNYFKNYFYKNEK